MKIPTRFQRKCTKINVIYINTLDFLLFYVIINKKSRKEEFQTGKGGRHIMFSRKDKNSGLLSNICVLAILVPAIGFLSPLFGGGQVLAKQMYATDYVNVRENADGESEVLTTLKPGALVESNDQEGNWIKVEADGISGYVYKSYLVSGYSEALQTLEEGTGGSIEDEVTITSYINSSKVNLRKKAGFKTKVKKTLKKNTKIEILSEKGHWVRIETSDGDAGYVYGAYVGEPDSAPAKAARKALKSSSKKKNKKAGHTKKHKKKKKKKETEVRPAGNYDPSSAPKGSGKYRKKAIDYAKGRLGDKYSQKKRDSKGYADCSSLIRDTFENVSDTYVGGDTDSQALTMANYYYKIDSPYDVTVGDLVYHFTGDNHTGIYLGKGKVLHASQSSGKVKISTYEKDCTYWEFGCDAASFCINQ